jgi:diguanylate cyclase (GGDEF)-like protein
LNEDQPSRPRLYPIADLASVEEGAALEGSTVEDTAAMREIALWSVEFLTNPHPELGRTGQVCPWTQPSIRGGHFFMTVLRGALENPVRAGKQLELLRAQFVELEPRSGRDAQLKTIVALFPDLSDEAASKVIVRLHEALKPTFVGAGLMLGEFYPSCPKTGLRNPAFRPLRSPLPLMVIRNMVETDIAFLSTEVRFAKSYLEKFRLAGRDAALNYLDSYRERVAPPQVAAVLGALQEVGGNTDLLRMREKDSLTGLYTVTYLLERLEDLMSTHASHGCSVMVFGLDPEESIEREYGRGCVAFVMWELARRVKQMLRSESVVVRHSRSAFGLLSTSNEEPDARSLAERVRTVASKTPLNFNGVTFELPIRVGYASLDSEITYATPLQFLARAERAWKSAQANRAEEPVSA